MIADEVEPLDSNRDDMRSASHTARLIQAISKGLLDETDVENLTHNLRYYLPVQIREETTMTPEEAQAIKKAKIGTDG